MISLITMFVGLKVPTLTLPGTGDLMPQIGYGTWLAEAGEVYEGKVARLMDFGAFVTILPGKDGLVHISQISDKRVENVSDELSEGQEVRVKVLEVDKQGRIRLSMRLEEGERQ